MSRKQYRERDIFDDASTDIESEKDDDIEKQKGTKEDQNV